MTRPPASRKRSRAAGEGSLRQRPDGTWEARYTVGWTPEGKQVRKSVYGRTRAEVADKLKVKLAQTERGAVVLAEHGRLTLAEYLKAFTEQHADRVTPSTQVRRRSLTAMVARHTVGTVALGDVKPAHLERLYRDLSREYAPSTVRHLAVYLGMAFRQALRHELVTRNPVDLAVRPKRGSERAARALDTGELARALSALEVSRNYGVLALIALTGLRHGEALGLRWQDVDEAAGTLTLCGTLVQVRGRPTWVPHGKTENALRVLHLGPPVRRLLDLQRNRLAAEDLPTTGAAWLFPSRGGGPQRQSVILSAWRTALTRAGITHPYRIHDLRHTLITHLIAQGADPRTVADIVGHSDPAITLRLYTHGREEARRAVLLRAAGDLDHLIPAGPVGVEQE